MNYEQVAESLRATARELELSEARAGSVDHLNKVLSQANNSLAAQIKELQDSEHSAKCKAEVATEVARSLHERVKELETYSHDAAVEIDSLTAECQNRAEAANMLRIDRQVVDQKLAGAEKTIRDLRAENDNLREASAEKDLRLSQYQEHSAGLRDSLHNHVLILDDKIKCIAGLEARINDLVANDEARGRAIDAYIEKIQALTVVRDRLDAALGRATQLVKDQQSRAQVAEQRVKELEDEAHGLNLDGHRILELEAAIALQRDRADGCEAAWVRERNRRFALEKDRGENMLAIDKLKQAIDLLKQRIYPQEKENYILKMNMRGRREQILSLQNDLAAVTRERDGLARILGGLVKMVQPPNA